MGVGKLSNGEWAVNGTPIYSPASGGTKIDHESIQGKDTDRTEDGVMHIDWVRTDVVKVNMTWKYLTGNEVANLKSLMQGKEFTLTFVDCGRTASARVYVSNIHYGSYSEKMYPREGGLYSDISANAIEI